MLGLPKKKKKCYIYIHVMYIYWDLMEVSVHSFSKWYLSWMYSLFTVYAGLELDCAMNFFVAQFCTERVPVTNLL